MTSQNKQKTKVTKQNRISESSTMTADNAVQLINNYFNEAESDKHGRSLSWRHCYNEFSRNRNAVDNQTLDYLSLHLAFYLASWGMYRGSTFLLQKDYKIHTQVVKIIQEEQYDSLFAITAEELKQEPNLDLLMNLSKRIKDYYKQETPAFDNRFNNATDTLVTKILLGTLGCVPAYDDYYTQSVKKHNISSGQYNKKSIQKIAEFYCENSIVFEKVRHELSSCGTEYPPMKLMDMCFWQDTFEN